MKKYINLQQYSLKDLIEIEKKIKNEISYRYSVKKMAYEYDKNKKDDLNK